ncbi:transposase [Streptomyces gardneri]|uniref:transposase n=1 Tax=Streptomyces gardneri TaxID=66892 RepID=UPI0035E311C6
MVARSAEVRAEGWTLGGSSQNDQRDSFRQRTGVPWRDLPARFGKWKTVYERHRRWSADGTWDRIFKAVLGRRGRDGLHRLVDGERGFNVLPRSSERRPSTQEGTPDSGKTDAPAVSPRGEFGGGHELGWQTGQDSAPSSRAARGGQLAHHRHPPAERPASGTPAGNLQLRRKA